MDWTLYAGEHLIYDRDIVADNGVRPYEVYEPKMKETTNGFGSLTFKATGGSPAVEYAQNLSPLVKAYNDGVLYWKGRVLSRTPDIRGEFTFYVEDFLGVLTDSVCRPYEFFGTPADFLSMLVDRHNEQVPDWQRFESVNCTVTSQFDSGNISRSAESYANTWAVIKDKLLSTLGGFIWVSYDANEKAILNYSPSPRDVSTQQIVIGENLASISIKESAEKLYTACLPIGAQDETTKEYLTIKSVNNGSDVLINQAAADRYGIIFAPVELTTWKYTTEAANLLAKAQEWIQHESAKTIQEIKLKAVDSGEGEPFFWLDSVQVIVPSRGLNSMFTISELTRMLEKPRAVDITLNLTGSNITSTAASTTASNARDIKEIRTNYVTAGQAASIAETRIQNSTWIEQEANRIVAGALQEFVQTGDFATLQQTVQSQFSILANEISINFNTLSSQITQQGTNIQQTLDQYAAWFRFLSYGLVIGNSASPIQMVLKNDVLYFCTDPDNVTTANAIAYFSAGQLYVNFVNVQNLTVGMTGRWLDVRIVGSGDNTCALFSGRLS